MPIIHPFQQLAASVRTPIVAALALALPFSVSAAVGAHASGNVVSAPTAIDEFLSVTNCDDSGPGSLREAYADAADGDAIDMTQLNCSLISLTTGALSHVGDGDITIDAAPGMIIDAGMQSRIFERTGNGTLTVSHLVMQNGQSTADPKGGCIDVSDSFTAIDSTISGCLVSSGDEDARGGAIYAGGSAILKGTMVSHAAVVTGGSAFGGGIYAGYVGLYSSDLPTGHGSTITSCSTTGNVYGHGGGIVGVRGVLIDHSAVTRNTSRSSVGGTFSAGPTTLVSSTVSDNRGVMSAGVASFQGIASYDSTIAFNVNTSTTAGGAAGLASIGEIKLFNSIVSNNANYSGVFTYDAEAYSSDDSPGVIVGSSNIIVKFPAGQAPSDTVSSDPLLGPLADNGGTTLSRAPQAGSPAIGKGVILADSGGMVRSRSPQPGNSDSTDGLPPAMWDQRGEPVPQVAGEIDIGAVQSRAVSDVIFEDGFDP